ncbi:MAG: hypothetical protein KGI54_14270 [Pseudomonadota bacterium]|nr:hypothetical protein [Pseudomonadota bacterium]
MLRYLIISIALIASPAFAAPPIYGPLQAQNALSELATNGTQATARANLGLLGMAQQAPNAVAITGGRIDGASIGATNPGSVTATNLYNTTGDFTRGSGGTSSVYDSLDGTGNWVMQLGGASALYNFRNSASNGMMQIGGSDNHTTVYGPFNFGSSIALTTGTNSVALNGLIQLSGSGSNYIANEINIANDSANMSNGLSGFTLQHNINGGASGSRNAFDISMNVNGVTSPLLGQYFTALNIIDDANSNAGGTALTWSSARGALYGLNISPFLYSGATDWSELKSAEFDRTAEAGSSFVQGANLVIGVSAGNAVQGTDYDTLIEMGRDRTATAAAVDGIMLGTENNTFPFDNTNGVFIGHQWGAGAVSGSNPQLKTFIDASYVHCLGACWQSPGFVVDGSGNISNGPASIGWSSSGEAINASGQVSNGISVTNGGAGFVNGEQVQVLNGLYTATVSSGAITALTPIVPATTIGAGPTSAQQIYGDGGAASGATATLTWAGANTLNLQSTSGGDTLIGATSAIATSATSGFAGLPWMVGAPSGTPSNGALSGLTVLNSSSKNLDIYVPGTGWYHVALTAGAN